MNFHKSIAANAWDMHLNQFSAIHTADTTDGKVHRIRESPSNPRKSIIYTPPDELQVSAARVSHFVDAETFVNFRKFPHCPWDINVP